MDPLSKNLKDYRDPKDEMDNEKEDNETKLMTENNEVLKQLLEITENTWLTMNSHTKQLNSTEQVIKQKTLAIKNFEAKSATVAEQRNKLKEDIKLQAPAIYSTYKDLLIHIGKPLSSINLSYKDSS